MTDQDLTVPEAPKGERIAKVMARAGLCSRRDAERWVAEGRVAVNGRLIDSPALNVTAEDVVEVDGTVLQEADSAQMWVYHKPPGLVTTHKDPEGRATVFETLPRELPRVISVGRLDLNSEGLLLLTNDGELARMLEKPSSGWVRTYRVRAFGWPPRDMIKYLKEGITVDRVAYGAIDVEIERDEGPNKWYVVRLTEGKNREIRRVFEHFGLSVSRLIRVAYGPFELGNLKREEVGIVPPRQVKLLKSGTPMSHTVKVNQVMSSSSAKSTQKALVKSARTPAEKSHISGGQLSLDKPSSSAGKKRRFQSDKPRGERPNGNRSSGERRGGKRPEGKRPEGKRPQGRR